MIFLFAPPQLVQPPEPAPPRPVRAQYAWGYAGADGEGKGTLSLLLEPATGKIILEIHGLGERLVLLTGNRSDGYRVQIPRENVDARAPNLGTLPLPFLPQLGTCEGLHRLVSEGTGTGVKVTRKDAKGPVKLRYAGKDDQGREVLVWLERTRREPVTEAPIP